MRLGCFRAAKGKSDTVNSSSSSGAQISSRYSGLKNNIAKIESLAPKEQAGTKGTEQSIPLNDLKNHEVKNEPVAPKEHTETGTPLKEINAKMFTLEEMQRATMNFDFDHVRGQGDTGLIYKGKLENEGQYAAIKRLEWRKTTEFLAELETLSRADHTNIIKLIGYCSEEEERLVVYDFMSFGSLNDNLFGNLEARRGLDWNVRVKIAAGAARGLEYLHYTMKPPIVHRDITCGHILLDEGYNPKLSNFAFARVRHTSVKEFVLTEFEGTPGYRAPEYNRDLNVKNDVYSFGVVLLEIFTGRRAVDVRLPGDHNETTLGRWAQKLYNGTERDLFFQVADSELQGRYPKRDLDRVLCIAVKCVEAEANKRPSVGEIVKAFDDIESRTYDPSAQSAQGSQGVAAPSSVSQGQSA